MLLLFESGQQHIRILQDFSLYVLGFRFIGFCRARSNVSFADSSFIRHVVESCYVELTLALLSDNVRINFTIYFHKTRNI